MPFLRTYHLPPLIAPLHSKHVRIQQLVGTLMLLLQSRTQPHLGCAWCECAD
jgi:hypothetical protein